MLPDTEDRRPGAGAATQLLDQATRPSAIVADDPFVERSRRRWRLDRQRHRRRVSAAFDRWAIGFYGPDAAADAGIRVAQYGYRRREPCEACGCSCRGEA